MDITKSINKLWALIALGMVCVFIAFAFSNSALKTNKELRSDFELLDSRISTINENMESIRDRLEDIERKINLIDLPIQSNGNGLAAR